MSTYKWCKLFDQIGCICKEKNAAGRRLVTEAQVDTILVASFHRPRKSTRCGDWHLNMPCKKVHTALQNDWSLKVVSTKFCRTSPDKEYTDVHYTFCSDLRCPDWKTIRFRSQELDQIARSNALSFHFCAFHFISSATVKRYTFRIYISCLRPRPQKRKLSSWGEHQGIVVCSTTWI
jgi:hypothetical protein